MKRRQRLEAERAQSRREPLALGDRRGDVGRRPPRDRRARAPPRSSTPARAAGARSARRRAPSRRFRSRHAPTRARTPSRTSGRRSRLRRSAGAPSRPPYSKYASSTTRGRAAGMSTIAPDGLCGRQTKVSTGSVVADVGAGDPGGDAVERVRRLVAIATRSPGAGVGPRAQHQDVVGSRAEHDVLRLDAVVVGDCAQELREAAVPVRLDPLECLGDRLRPGRRRRVGRRVPVEAKHVLRGDSGPAPRSPPRRAPTSRGETAVRGDARCEPIPAAHCAVIEPIYLAFQ